MIGGGLDGGVGSGIDKIDVHAVMMHRRQRGWKDFCVTGVDGLLAKPFDFRHVRWTLLEGSGGELVNGAAMVSDLEV